MLRRITLLFILFSITAPARGAMLRVTEVRDGRTIAVDRAGKTEALRLSGVEVLDEVGARELLRWTIGSSWILAEKAGDGWRVWRSPDALFINAELVLRGFARATQPGIAPAPQAMVTYLGQLNLAPPAEKAKKPDKTEKKVTPTRRKTGSDTSRRSSASPSRRARSPRPPSGH